MRVIPPVALFGAAAVTSSNISEPDAGKGEVAYNGATTYALNAQVVDATQHRKYISLQAGNTGHALPVYANGELSNSWWSDIGPTNKWAMFDLMRNTQTLGGTSIQVVLTPGQRVDSVALMNVSGQSVQITGTVSGLGTVYDSGVIPIQTRVINDWYSYFFDPFVYTPSVIKLNIPPYTSIVLTITITDAGGNAKCGACVIGQSTYIGAIEFNPVSDAINFSTVSRDTYGNATLTPRRSIPKTTQKVYADSSIVNDIRALRTALNAAVAVWCGLDDVTNDYSEALLIMGFYRSWTINIASPYVVEQDLEIEEM